jgi:hypothetical protein
LFLQATQTNLKIFDIPEQHLRNFTTTEKDRKRGNSRFPPSMFRNFDVDLVKEEKGADQEDETTLDEGDEQYIKEQEALRKQQYMANTDLSTNAEEEDPDEDEVKQSIAGETPSTLVFQRGDKKDNTRLEDFQLMKIVGKGTFGKVFQVRHAKTGKVYAMKCIRKDVVLEN